MTKYIFINEAINDAFVSYMNSKDKPNSLDYNKFNVCVLRMLILIYGEKGILSSYSMQNARKFDNMLCKYGLKMLEVKKFEQYFEMYNKFEIGQKNRNVKKKNKYFNLVQMSLIDMLVSKNKVTNIDFRVLTEFYGLLFTANSFDFYRKSCAVATAYNPYEVDEYFKRFYAISGG